MGLATGDGGYDVSFGKHLYKGCCDGGFVGGVQLSIAEGWWGGVGDVKLIPASRNCPVIWAIFLPNIFITRFRNLQSTYVGYFVLHIRFKQF